MQLRSKILMAFGLAAVMAGAAAGPARADDWRWHRYHEWHRPGVVVYGAPGYYAPPGYVYAPQPPVVYEAPPPVVYAPPPAPSLNVVVPLRFR